MNMAEYYHKAKTYCRAQDECYKAGCPFKSLCSVLRDPFQISDKQIDALQKELDKNN